MNPPTPLTASSDPGRIREDDCKMPRNERTPFEREMACVRSAVAAPGNHHKYLTKDLLAGCLVAFLICTPSCPAWSRLAPGVRVNRQWTGQWTTVGTHWRSAAKSSYCRRPRPKKAEIAVRLLFSRRTSRSCSEGTTQPQ